MINTSEYNIAESFKVSNDINASDYFNLKFNRNIKPHTGCGIYLILFKNKILNIDEVVYLGKLQPINSDIFSTRWLRHIETMTLRGRRIGFGSLSKKAKMLSLATDSNLNTMIQDIPDSRFKDTGVTMALNRIIFANENWASFSQCNETNILNGFTFIHIKFENVADKSHAKSLTSLVENTLLSQFYPVCNKEYKGEVDRKLCNKKGVMKQIQNTLQENEIDYSIHTFK